MLGCPTQTCILLLVASKIVVLLLREGHLVHSEICIVRCDLVCDLWCTLK